MPIPLDVTGELRDQGHLVDEDHNPEDTVYFYRDGEPDSLLIKVKAWHDKKASQPGCQIIRFSGAVVGPNGKAIRDEGGNPLIYALDRTITIMAYDRQMTDQQIIVDVEAARMECVKDTYHAHRIAGGMPIVPGLGIIPPDQAPVVDFVMPVTPLEEIQAREAPLALPDYSTQVQWNGEPK